MATLELGPKVRVSRSVAASADSTRLVAVGGQWIEFQCPLASDLRALATTNARDDHTISWRKDGLLLNQLNPRQKINAHNGTLVLVAGQPKLDEGLYSCSLVSATNPDEPIKSHTFELRLLVAPRLAPFEFPADVQVGMRLMLTCSVLEGQRPVSFVWLKDNQIVAAGSQQAAGNSLAQVHQQQLAEKAALSSQVARHGDSIVAGDQQAKADELLALLSDSNIRVRQADDYSILSIERADLRHAGRYTCSAQNDAARSSHSAQLLINAPPTLTIEPRDAELVSGQSATIHCAASGQPRPTVSWLRARENQARHWDYVQLYDNLRYSTLANGSLAIANVSQREQGFYLCAAKNGFGPEVTKLIKITVHEPARFSPKYKSLEVRVDERANLVCAATGELPIAIEWLDKDSNVIGKNHKRFIIDDEPQELKVQANSSVSRLIVARATRADSGHFTCRASNNFGSDKMISNLLVQDVPDKVAELKVTNVTSSTISIRWQLGFTGNSPVTAYLVQYQSDDPLDDLLQSASDMRPHQEPQVAANSSLADAILSRVTPTTSQPNGITSSLRAALEALNGPASKLESADEAIDRTLVELTLEQSSTHALIKDLSPFCVYRLRIASINKIGLGEFSDWIRAKTEEAPPGGSALKISATATGPNSIKVSWSPPDRRAWNGQLLGFNIAYRPLDSSYELNKTVEWSAPSIQSLMVNARDSDNQKQQNVIRSAGQNQSDFTAQDSSTRISGENSRLLLRQHLRQLLALQHQELVAHLTNLQRSTTYLIWIQAINNRGLGPQSHAISVKTLDDVPPTAPAIRIQSASSSSLTIAWSMLSNFVSSANQYSLFFRRMPRISSNLRLNSSSTLESSVTGAGGDEQLPESGPFVERTISSQRLLMNGNIFLGSQLEPALEVNPSTAFMHQQSQHYQQFVYTLEQLECGSSYEIYMTTRNSVGKSEPSPTVTGRTLGEPPLAPANKNLLFARIGVNDVALNLAAWSSGGCPLTHLTVRYKQVPSPLASASTSGANSQSVVGNSSYAISWPVTTSVPSGLLMALNKELTPPTRGVLDQNSPKILDSVDAEPTATFHLKNLLPSTCYELDIVAHNSAGQTTAQYEFVTSNSNGTRGGYSRREGVFRIDHRGAQMDQPQDRLGDSLVEQQTHFSNHSGPGAQILPLVLLVLCFVCLIISSTFCYYRLTDSWKHQRRASDDLNQRSLNCQPDGSASPSVYGKSPWRASGRSSVLKLRQQECDDNLEANNLHQCLRDPASSRHLLSSTLNRPNTNFAQSVSMRDFNQTAFGGKHPTAATLNFKSNRQCVQEANKPGTLRARHTSGDSSYESRASESQQALLMANYRQDLGYSVYAPSCKQKSVELYAAGDEYHTDNRKATYTSVQHSNGDLGLVYEDRGVGQYNYPTADSQQETSWTNYAEQLPCGNQENRVTNYAIPSSQFPLESQVNQNISQVDESSYQVSSNFQDSSIDACIQQLISQGSGQQEEHQPPYALIIGQKSEVNAGRCLYGPTASTFESTLVNGCHSVIDSSSSSSGIDVANHLDCASTLTGTSSSNCQNSFHSEQANRNE